MFSFILSKNLDSGSRNNFLDTHKSCENYSLRTSSSKFILVTWGTSKLFDIKCFDAVTIALDGYCFAGNKRVDVLFIYKAYLSGDLAILRALNGSFNIIIYNDVNNDLLLFTDKFGTRALFCCETSSEIVISGRLKLVAQTLGDHGGFNPMSVSEYIYFGCFIQNGKTLFNDIILLKSSTELVFSDQLSINQYWMPKADYQMSPISLEKDFELFYKEFKDIWLAAFDRCSSIIGKSESALIPLSAGFDSRAILSELSERPHPKITSFTISTTPSFEADTAALIAGIRNIEHIPLTMTEDSFFKNYQIDLGVLCSDAMIYGSPYISNLLYRTMTDKGSFVLSGFSGDPLMGSHSIPLTENQSQPLLDYCFDKYSDLETNEKSLFDEIIDEAMLKEEMEKSTAPFSDMPLTLAFDSWYPINRNRYTTQMGVLCNRDKFDYILPFCDTELFDFINTMNFQGRLNRLYFSKAMRRMYSDTFSARSSVEPPLLYRAKYYLYRVIDKLTPIRPRYDMQYKLNFNALLKENKEFQNYCLGAAENLEDQGILPKNSCKKVIQNNINGARRYWLVDRIVSLNSIYENYS